MNKCTSVGLENSAIETIQKTLRQLKYAVEDIKKHSGNEGYPNSEDNTTTPQVCKKVAFDDPIPVEDLIILDGLLEGKKVSVLKDDGCNTNVVSRDFFEKNRGLFKWRERDVEARHSKTDSVENSSEVILGGTLIVGKHSYKSNWLVSNCRYEVLLGMPWHVAHNPLIDYSQRTVKVNSDELIPHKESCKPKNQVTSMSMEKFRSLLKKESKSAGLQLLQLMSKQEVSGKHSIKDELFTCKDEGLRALLGKYKEVFRDQLPK